eukprot:Gregarina_sp_Poly_1__1109@NODE_1271_length_4528_cov_192_799821_g849_i1_p1_GENE_NODE_1271_length_4528_cov_192_799821_g849_i1NODE_1271_length_4528_cov_192_799821_g849_i1_p1_ORF_typecomplete_len959_score133_33ANAPC4_WD40/PF12894_7/0_0001ANAPC4_WD40/PF12894_7/0_23ANAPC4_WD40/PF12894_7/4_2e09ANAPC4_WD40/PF12894_7/12ANAPC4_WD40/PF12894_7/1_6e03WD40/PF00400_32/3_1e06WD40/PF00400_32/1_8e05WD40/PF00400_32/9e02WD40/PF00400_32/0_024WD40/PF00400_32/6_8e03eIF2A/PF08662_11/4_6e02eIF2A/PF08662_11/2_3e05eIF2A/P
MLPPNHSASNNEQPGTVLSIYNSAYQSLPSVYVDESPAEDSLGFRSPPVSEGGGTVPSEFYDAEEDRLEESCSRRRKSLFPEEAFSDGAALTESVRASEAAGHPVSNILSLSSAEPPQSVEVELVKPKEPAASCPTLPSQEKEETQTLTRLMSSPMSAAAPKTKSTDSSPLAPIRSSVVCASDSPVFSIPKEKDQDIIESETECYQHFWPLDEAIDQSSGSSVVAKHTRLVACAFDDSELLHGVSEVSCFMNAKGELGPTDIIDPLADSGDTTPFNAAFDYPMMIPRQPIRMETVFEEHEENTSSLEKENTTSSHSSSSSSSHCSTNQDRLKFEDMLGLRVERIRIESSSASAEKPGIGMSRPTSESQQTDTQAQDKSTKWAVRLKGRFSRRLAVSTVSHKVSSDQENVSALRKSKRTSGGQLLERFMKRTNEINLSATSNRRLTAEERAAEAARSVVLFPNYLKFHQNGWIQIPVKSRLNLNDKQTTNIIYNRCKGFEGVWLIDKDDILVGIKEWMNSSLIPLVQQYQSMTPAVSPGVKAVKPNRRGRGTQTPAPPPSQSVDTSVSGGPIWCLALSKDGKYLAAGSRKGLIYLWEMSTFVGLLEGAFGERYLRRKGGFAGHTGGVISVQWSGNPNSYVLVSCAVDKTVRIWTLNCDTTLAILRCTSLPVGVSFTRRNLDDQIVVAGLDGSVKLVNLTPAPSTFQVQNPSEPPPLVNCEAVASYNFPEAITSLSVSPNGRYLACGMQFGTVTIHNIENGSLEKQIECRNRRGKHAKGEKVRCYKEKLMKFDSQITGIDWTQKSSSEFICVTGRDSRIRVIFVQDELKQLKLKGSDIRLKAYFDPGNRFVIGVTEVNRVAIWDLMEAGQLKPTRDKKNSLRLSSNHSRKIEIDSLKSAHTAPPLESRISESTDSATDNNKLANTGIQTSWIPDLPADVKKRPTANASSSFKGRLDPFVP